MTRRNIHAFTMVEIAVMLAILALVVAAVTNGNYLLEVAKLHSVISEVNKYQTAIGAFKKKYNAFPGDIPNATNYWGTATTNGNGNERIAHSGGPSGNEGLRAWQQLNLAKILEGKYTGTGIGTGDQADIGTNIPQSAYNGMGINVGYGLDYALGASSANQIVMGASTTNAINNAMGVEATHAKFLDKKADDGLPQSGNIFEPTGACISGTAYAASYASGCILYFRVEPE